MWRVWVVLLLVWHISAEERGNHLCWMNSENSFETCCPHTSNDHGEDPTHRRRASAQPFKGNDECWHGDWYTEEFCCHPIPDNHAVCYEEIEERVRQKVATLLENGNHSEASVQGGVFGYEMLLGQPVTLWSIACEYHGTPFLYSPGCACCEPKDEQACGEEPGKYESDILYARCCFPVYARKTFEEPDPKLQESIENELDGLLLSRSMIFEKGPWQEFESGGRGCVISIVDGDIYSCDTDHACPVDQPAFDCSYVRAFLLLLNYINIMNPLPDLHLVLNPGSSFWRGEVPAFTRLATRWSGSIATLFEWQLHPNQCRKHTKLSKQAAMFAPWEGRKNTLIWRGSNSNIFVPGCDILKVDDSEEEMEICGTMPRGGIRHSVWNLENYQNTPRGRLIWMTKYVDFIDARLTPPRGGDFTMEENLEQLLRREGLIIESEMTLMDQLSYKYVLAVEGRAAADRVYWQLFTGSVVIIPHSRWHVFASHNLMEPWVHYVPCRADLSDLVDTLLWLRENDAEAEQIGRNGANFARKYFTYDGVAYFLDRQLRTYAGKLQD